MKHSTLLSIILTTHTKSDYFHALLGEVIKFGNKKFEVIIIDDSTDVVTTQFIEREIGKIDNDRVYLYTHEERTGRASSLNEALVHASGSFIWAPLRADRLNESLLDEAIRRFKADPAAFWVMDYNLPKGPLDWIRAADEGDLPDDSCLVWNRNVIQDDQLFFNPFMDQLHGAELALRLATGNVWHVTDPFFVIAKDQSTHAGFNDIQEFMYTLLRLTDQNAEREKILGELANIESRINNRVADDDFLLQARQLLQQGDANRSLEIINRFLKRTPDHHEAMRIKITSLEKLRRHVEAAELKYNLQKQPRKPEEQAELPLPNEEKKRDDKKRLPKEINVSVIIPTTGHGKPQLETALVHLDEATDAAVTELIVIDNASIDDTFDYLEQLKEESFLNIRVITNQANKGFAASVNQGIEAASGEYILVMHNDVHIPKNSMQLLMKGFAQTDGVAMTVPVLNATSVKAQSRKPAPDESYVLAERADSCCFMIKNDIQVRFDEDFGLCFFEMEDFCRQLLAKDLKITVSRNTIVEHHPGGTTRLMGMELDPAVKWENRARFYKKWNKPQEYKIPLQGSHPKRFLRLGAPYNPMKPEPEWINAIQEYLTSEVRTEILRGNWNEEELLTIILTLLIADERELLRTLEDKLNGIKPDDSLLMMFVHYYYHKNIFSRCKHYINMAEKQHPVFDLYRLKILVADKNFKEASDLLNRMLEYYPSSPDLYFLAAEMYRKNNDQGEANSFYAMAGQLDPIRFNNDSAAFELNP